MNLKMLAVPVACLLAFNATAAEEEKQTITGSSELGMLFKSGNTKSTDLKAGIDVKHETGLWRNNATMTILAKKTEYVDGETGEEVYDTTDQKWTAVLQTNYTLNTERKDYVWGNVSFEDDRFSSFEYQSSYTAGWGKRWYENGKTYFDAEAGIGYKVDRTIAGTDQNDAIIRLAATFEHELYEGVAFKQTFSANMVPDIDKNSKYRAVSALTTKLMESLALKFTFTVDHNTKVARGSANTDTETALTLVYSF